MSAEPQRADEIPSQHSLVKRVGGSIKKVSSPRELKKIQDRLVPVVRENVVPACKEYSDKTITWIDKSIHYIARKDSGTANEALNTARGPIVFGIWVLIIVFGVFGIWATFAPLNSAAVAHGSIVLDSSKKTVQHLEGGIIDELLVREGDFVQAGQPLLKLNDTTAKARLDMVMGQYLSAKATEARLIAERDALDKVTFDDEVLKRRDEPDVAKIIDSQTRLFDTRRKAVSGQIDILNQRIAQFNDEIRGLTSQSKSTNEQLLLINQEVAIVQKLLKSGNAQKPRLLALQRRAAELGGIRGQYQAQIAKAKQAITEAEMEINNAKTHYSNEVVDSLKETQVQVADLAERRRAAQDIMDRIVVVAPQSGIVTDLQFHTKGGVINPGAKIMDLVPQDDKLIIEAKVSLQDRDIVHEGLKARVRLTAYKSRQIPPLDGKVLNVSPDRFIDQGTRETYYKARILIDEKELSLLDYDVELQPGMPADVLIITGTRSLMGYLLSPISDSFHKAFREQ